MGCGASKSADPGIAPAEKAQAPAKKEIQKEIPPTKDVVPKKESKADGADQIRANFDAAAAVTVATGDPGLGGGREGGEYEEQRRSAPVGRHATGGAPKPSTGSAHLALLHLPPADQL